MIRVEEIDDPRGGRCRIRTGDPIRVAAGRTDPTSFLARFLYAELDEAGTVVQVTVIGGRGFDPKRAPREQTGIVQYRTLLPERLRRVAVSRYADA